MIRVACAISSSVLILTACTGTGESAAHQWLHQQSKSEQKTPPLPQIPDVVDTVPVSYAPGLYADPFNPNWPAVGSGYASQALTNNPTARFPTAEIGSLHIIGVIKKTQENVALVSNGLRSESIHIGDLIGSAGAEVRAISESGIELGFADGSQLMMAFKKRGS